MPTDEKPAGAAERRILMSAPDEENKIYLVESTRIPGLYISDKELQLRPVPSWLQSTREPCEELKRYNGKS